jgi:hypothetical protein
VPCRATLPDALFPHFRGRGPATEARLGAFWEAWDHGASIAAPLRALGPVDFIVARPRAQRLAGAVEVFRNDALAVYRTAVP